MTTEVEEMVCIIKKDGTKEEFNVQKIVRAVNKSAGRILYQFTEEEIDFICRYATEKVEGMGKTGNFHTGYA